MLWAESKAKLLTELWLLGSSATHISQVLGVSRSAVMGKINRLHLLRPPRPKPPAGVSILKLDNFNCHAPLDGQRDAYGITMFCGAVPVAKDTPYCAAHAATFYNFYKPPQRNP